MGEQAASKPRSLGDILGSGLGQDRPQAEQRRARVREPIERSTVDHGRRLRFAASLPQPTQVLQVIGGEFRRKPPGNGQQRCGDGLRRGPGAPQEVDALLGVAQLVGESRLQALEGTVFRLRI